MNTPLASAHAAVARRPLAGALSSACTAQRTLPSPLGPVLVARTPRGLAGLWFEGQKDHPGPLCAPVVEDDRLLVEAQRQLDAYWMGRLRVFDLPLDLHGTPFQRAVWQALLAVPAGHTRSYRDIARDIGLPSATRAVGAAVGRNPVSIVVPCHRIVGSSGHLTGYAGGLERKVALLRLEGALAL
ncbi:methylated-DNA--[protein]-cysteine S-methyltransferase [Schlegelella aquatica]|uniref:methylated-DNA--[protein]-cysteine S-methyltransferase n=1 Tax=Caldimonas aquatica TaxID=376175 RepID=UPI003752D796